MLSRISRVRLCVTPWTTAILPFPGDSVVKNLPANAGDPDSIPGWGRSSGEGNGNPLQYSCLEDPMDRGAWRATVAGVRGDLATKQQQEHRGGRGSLSGQGYHGGVLLTYCYFHLRA